jgi:hypothetical protein
MDAVRALPRAVERRGEQRPQRLQGIPRRFAILARPRESVVHPPVPSQWIPDATLSGGGIGVNLDSEVKY